MEGLYLAIGAGALALAFAVYLTYRVLRAEEGTERMQEIGAAIQEGANAFLRREYTVLAIFVVVVFVALLLLGFFHELASPEVAYAYIVGAFASGLTGVVGMRIAVRANMRTAAAAREAAATRSWQPPGQPLRYGRPRGGWVIGLYFVVEPRWGGGWGGGPTPPGPPAAARPTAVVAAIGIRYARRRRTASIATAVPTTAPIHTERCRLRNVPTTHRIPMATATPRIPTLRHDATAIAQATAHV
jgi:hypothetical protein